MIEQKLIQLSRSDLQYHRFFNYGHGFEGTLSWFLKAGWIVKEMDLDKRYESGWVLLERKV